MTIGRGNGRKTPGLLPWGLTRQAYWNAHRKRLRLDHRQSADAITARRQRNQRISQTKRRRHPPARTCPRGHTWTVANTRIDQQGRRHCRACWKVSGALRWQVRKWRAKMAAAHPDHVGTVTERFRQCLRRYRYAQATFREWQQERLR